MWPHGASATAAASISLPSPNTSPRVTWATPHWMRRLRPPCEAHYTTYLVSSGAAEAEGYGDVHNTCQRSTPASDQVTMMKECMGSSWRIVPKGPLIVLLCAREARVMGTGPEAGGPVCHLVPSGDKGLQSVAPLSGHVKRAKSRRSAQP